MVINKTFRPIVTKLFIRGRKLNIHLLLFLQSCFAAPKNVRVNTTHYFIMKIPNRLELQQITINYSSHVKFKDFMRLYIKYTAKPYSFLVIDTNLPSDNTSLFRKNVMEEL